MERKLATIRQIDNIQPIEGADMIELATVGGWKVVVAKDVNHKVGDLVVYCEIDSFLPIEPEFEFLRKSSYKKMADGTEGFRLKTIKLRGHHFAWYYIYDNCNINQIDHINGVTHDNRIVNLRNVTPNQNQWNRTRAKGYCFYKNSNKWKAQIQLNNKNTHLGYFNTEQEARNAYLAAKEIYHKF